MGVSTRVPVPVHDTEGLGGVGVVVPERVAEGLRVAVTDQEVGVAALAVAVWEAVPVQEGEGEGLPVPVEESVAVVAEREGLVLRLAVGLRDAEALGVPERLPVALGLRDTEAVRESVGGEGVCEGLGDEDGEPEGLRVAVGAVGLWEGVRVWLLVPEAVVVAEPHGVSEADGERERDADAVQEDAEGEALRERVRVESVGLRVGGLAEREGEGDGPLRVPGRVAVPDAEAVVERDDDGREAEAVAVKERVRLPVCVAVGVRLKVRVGVGVRDPVTLSDGVADAEAEPVGGVGVPLRDGDADGDCVGVAERESGEGVAVALQLGERLKEDWDLVPGDAEREAVTEETEAVVEREPEVEQVVVGNRVVEGEGLRLREGLSDREPGDAVALAVAEPVADGAVSVAEPDREPDALALRVAVGVRVTLTLREGLPVWVKERVGA